MSVDLGEADAMLTACARNGVKLIVAYQRPHHATWLAARDLIRQGAIGSVQQIQMDDGGNLLNNNSHNIRLALFLCDEARAEWVTGAVERTTDAVERGLPAEDACLGLVGLSNGATILIQSNLVSGLGQGCRVIGSNGIMELDTTSPPDDQIPSDAPMYMPEGPSARYNTEIGTVRYFSTGTDGWVTVEAPWQDAWAHQCQEAIDWVEGRVAEPISRGERGRAVQEIMMALFESARKKQRIYLPLKTRVNPLRLMVDSGDLPVEWPGSYERRARIVRGEGMSWHTRL